MDATESPISLLISLGSPGCRTHLSIREAEADIEPPDVDESPLYDSVGRALKAIPDEKKWRARIAAAEAEPHHQKELAELIRSGLGGNVHPKSWLARSGILDQLGISEEWLASAPLRDLVARAADVEMAWRSRQTFLRRLRNLFRRS